MSDAGLVGLDVEEYAQAWRGKTAGCLLPVAVSGELRHQLLAAGLSEADLNDLMRIMMDPATVILGNPTLSTIGVRPAA
jgi:hypothetical protein